MAGNARHAPATPDHWLHRKLRARLLWPLSLLYGVVSGMHRLLYRYGLKHAQVLPVPVIVVGNVVAGGAGKTPTTLAIVAHLQARGWHPGVVSRGYGRKLEAGDPDPRAVAPDSPAAAVGDEPLLIARAARVPVYVGRRRADAGQALLAAHPEVDILVCDDGLQHHALARDIEICVFDERGTGNGWLLPAGPLREPWPRRRPAARALPPALLMQTGTHEAPMLQGQGWHARRQLAPQAHNRAGDTLALADLAGRPTVALAGIARPQAFFDMLAAAGVRPQRTIALPDHDDFSAVQDLDLGDGILLCTEKDAVKLWNTHPQAYAIGLTLAVPAAFWLALDQRLAAIR